MLRCNLDPFIVLLLPIMAVCSPRSDRYLRPGCQVTEGDTDGSKYIHRRASSTARGVTSARSADLPGKRTSLPHSSGTTNSWSCRSSPSHLGKKCPGKWREHPNRLILSDGSYHSFAEGSTLKEAETHPVSDEISSLLIVYMLSSGAFDATTAHRHRSTSNCILCLDLAGKKGIMACGRSRDQHQR
ncbi:hypothetical protein BDM02DRAFT_1972117 [Thelephora ganbajun]|uniref:Uncharacterized protein n=1 Tax=Thelephora ganbajun TaxID=370292 RepID=A0ACB6ZHR8_THEGA|nr:hypothetical protein BDM02DRAFT_1972117 [Thelephora ganbajun]